MAQAQRLDHRPELRPGFRQVGLRVGAIHDAASCVEPDLLWAFDNGADGYLNIKRVSIASTTTVYLSIFVSFTVVDPVSYGRGVADERGPIAQPSRVR